MRLQLGHGHGSRVGKLLNESLKVPKVAFIGSLRAVPLTPFEEGVDDADDKFRHDGLRRLH